jgi:hypothetical protein
MAAIGRFAFVPRSITGSMVGASGVLPTGTDGYLYYEIIDGMSTPNSLGYVSGTGAGKRVGVIGYDYIQSRWSCLFTTPPGLATHQPTIWENDIQQIKDFMATLTAPQLTNENGDDINYPASIPPTI